MTSLGSRLWTFVCCVLLLFPSSFVRAVSECLPTGEDQSSFHCYNTRKWGESQGIWGAIDQTCEDTNNNCEDWAKRGECSSNPQYMLIYCRESCESCISGHAGEVQIAPDESIRHKVMEHLVETQKYLKEVADFKAKILRTCRNENKLCTHWAVKGECEKNQKFMNENCKPACKKCG